MSDFWNFNVRWRYVCPLFFCSSFISLSTARLRELILTRARLHTRRKKEILTHPRHSFYLLSFSRLFLSASLCFSFSFAFSYTFSSSPSLSLSLAVSPPLPSPQHVGQAPLWSSPPVTILLTSRHYECIVSNAKRFFLFFFTRAPQRVTARHHGFTFPHTSASHQYIKLIDT